MNYELAKELKDAGFPLTPMEREHQLLDIAAIQIPEKGTWYVIPTLSELIEACGSEFAQLQQGQENKWSAGALRYRPFGKTPKEIIEKGSTPEEAVARLWLALQKK